ncbi:hypothetical protein ACSCBZ_02595 [Streptomyces niveiscabiei]|uniref:hypothetical protein n=1 Tax=Streptomyces niveiscabiei TaxID=164115 RepID=UPI0006EB857F|nr:hypothetical protein [Streptomyces niveiscabiei]
MVALATALLLTNSPYTHRVPAAACVAGESETRSRSAVDDGEIRFTESTKYDEARTHAAKVWQSSSGALSKIKVRTASSTAANAAPGTTGGRPPRMNSGTRSGCATSQAACCR